jgi:hypothetical protein
MKFGGETNVVSVGIGIAQVVRKVAAGNLDADMCLSLESVQ